MRRLIPLAFAFVVAFAAQAFAQPKTIPALTPISPLTGSETVPICNTTPCGNTTTQAIANLGPAATISLTADTNIAAGTAVSINSSGHAVQTWGPAPQLSSVKDIFAGQNAGSFNSWSLLSLGSGNYLATLGVFSGATTEYGAVPISVSGNTITVGTFLSNVLFKNVGNFAWNSTGLLTGQSAALSTTSFVLVYGDPSTLLPFAVVGTISGGVITLGTPVQLGAAALASYASVTALSATKFVVVYDDNSTDYAVVAGTVSGTAITLGTPVTIASAPTGSIPPIIFTLSSTSVLIIYSDAGNSNSLTALGATLSGTAITLDTAHAAALSASVQNTPQYITGALFDSTHFMVGWLDTATTNSIAAGSLSGTVPTWGAQVQQPTVGGFTDTAEQVPFFGILDATHAAVALNNGTPSIEIYTLTGGTTLSPTTALSIPYGSLSPPQPNNGPNGSNFGFATYLQGLSNLAVLSSANFMVVDGLSNVYEMNTSGNISVPFAHITEPAYQIAPVTSSQVIALFNDVLTRTIRARLVNFNPINTGPVGFAASAITSGNPGNITFAGSVGGFSGLTAGTSYYVNGDGTLVTANTGHFGCTALSSTTCLIGKQNYLLNRDLDPASNDNSPVGLAHAA